MLDVAKSPTSRADPTVGLLNALAKLPVALSNAGRIVYGTTIGTNAILERTGAPVWVITTRGFRDTLEIARTNRTVLYDIRARKPAPVVPRARVIEVDERMAFDGTIVRPLRDEDVTRGRRSHQDGDQWPRAGRCGAVLPAQLRQSRPRAGGRARSGRGAAGLVRLHFPGGRCPSSASTSGFSTAALNAYIGPTVGGYLDGAGPRARRPRVRRPGVHHHLEWRDHDRRASPRDFPSTPCSPARRAVWLPRFTSAGSPGIDDLVTYDMGGTSTDVCLVEDLEPTLTTEQHIAGLPNRDAADRDQFHRRGRGQHRLARRGRRSPRRAAKRGRRAGAGLLRARRNGADHHRRQPYPPADGRRRPARGRAGSRRGAGAPGAAHAARACARSRRRGRARRRDHSHRGGAHGRGDQGDLDRQGTRSARLCRSSPTAARDPCTRPSSPRSWRCRGCIVPPAPGNFSAFGSLISDLRRDYVRTRLTQTRQGEFAEVDRMFAELEGEARAELAAEGVSPDRISMIRFLGMRYVGQSWELIVRVPEGLDSMAALETPVPAGARAALRARERRRGRDRELPPRRHRRGAEALAGAMDSDGLAGRGAP